jgi:hypothetical protein
LSRPISLIQWYLFRDENVQQMRNLRIEAESEVHDG